MRVEGWGLRAEVQRRTEVLGERVPLQEAVHEQVEYSAAHTGRHRHTNKAQQRRVT